jgi:hypothetical protein
LPPSPWSEITNPTASVLEGAAGSNNLGIGFDADAGGFATILKKAKAMGVLRRGPVDHTSVSKGMFVEDPDGRQIEIAYNDLGVFLAELTSRALPAFAWAENS